MDEKQIEEWIEKRQFITIEIIPDGLLNVATRKKFRVLHVDEVRSLLYSLFVSSPIPMILHCPECSCRHIDEGDFATKPHHTHACQKCGFVWRPCIEPTVGVQFLPGFKNEEQRDETEGT